MVQECHYNPAKDLQKVDCTGVFDLTAAYAAGSIPASVPLEEARYNGIEDPNSIGFRPRDQFELAQASKATLDYKAPEGE